MISLKPLFLTLLLILISSTTVGSKQVTSSYQSSTPFVTSTSTSTVTHSTNLQSITIFQFTYPITHGTIHQIIFGPALINQQDLPVPLIGFSYRYQVAGLPSWCSYSSSNNTLKLNIPSNLAIGFTITISYSDFKGNKLKLNLNLVIKKQSINFNYIAAELANRKNNTVIISFPTFTNKNLESSQQGSVKMFVIDAGVTPWTASVKLMKHEQRVVMQKMEIGNGNGVKISGMGGINSLSISNTQNSRAFNVNENGNGIAGQGLTISSSSGNIQGGGSSSSSNRNTVTSSSSYSTSSSSSSSTPSSSIITISPSTIQPLSSSSSKSLSTQFLTLTPTASATINGFQGSILPIVHQSPISQVTTPYLVNGVMKSATTTTQQTNAQSGNSGLGFNLNGGSGGGYNQNKILINSRSSNGVSNNYQSLPGSSGNSGISINSNTNTNNVNSNSNTISQYSVSAAPPLVNGHSIVIINEVLPIGQVSKLQYSNTTAFAPPSIINLGSSNSQRNVQLNINNNVNQQNSQQQSTKTTTTTTTTHNLPQNVNTQSNSFTNQNNIVIQPTIPQNTQPVIQPIISNSQQIINHNTNINTNTNSYIPPSFNTITTNTTRTQTLSQPSYTTNTQLSQIQIQPNSIIKIQPYQNRNLSLTTLPLLEVPTMPYSNNVQNTVTKTTYNNYVAGSSSNNNFGVINTNNVNNNVNNNNLPQNSISLVNNNNVQNSNVINTNRIITLPTQTNTITNSYSTSQQPSQYLNLSPQQSNTQIIHNILNTSTITYSPSINTQTNTQSFQIPPTSTLSSNILSFPEKIYSSQNGTHYVQLIKVPATNQINSNANFKHNTNPFNITPSTPPQNIQTNKYETNNAGQLASILASLNISIPQTLLDQSLFKVESTNTTSNINNNNLISGSNNNNGGGSLTASSIPAYLTDMKSSSNESKNGMTISSTSTSTSSTTANNVNNNDPSAQPVNTTIPSMSLANLNPGLVIPDEILKLTSSTVSNANKLNQNIISSSNSIPSTLNVDTLKFNLTAPAVVQLTRPTPLSLQ